MRQTKTVAGWMKTMIDEGLAAECGPAFVTYCVVRRHANPRKNMVACVGLDRIAMEAGLSISGAKKHLGKLEQLGLISRKFGAKKGGGRLLLVRIEPPAKATQVALAAKVTQVALHITNKRPNPKLLGSLYI